MNKKKPPIDLNELSEEYEGEDEVEESQPGELEYLSPRRREGSRGYDNGASGRDWKGLAGCLIAATVVAGLLLLFLTPSKASIKTLDENIQEVNSRIEAVGSRLDSGLAGLNQKAAATSAVAQSAKDALSTYMKRDELATTYANQAEALTPADLGGYAKASDVTPLTVAIAALETRIKSLEEEAEEAAAATEGIPWTISAAVPVNWAGTAYVTSYPWLVEEEGYYELTLELAWNAGAAKIPAGGLSVVLTPRDRRTGAFVDDRSSWAAIYPAGKDWNVVVRSLPDGSVRQVSFVYPSQVEVGGAVAGSVVYTLDMYLAYE